MTKTIVSMNRRKFLELVATISAGTAGGLGMISLSDEAKINSENINILKGKNAPAGGSWAEVVKASLANPLGQPMLRTQDLRGKTIAVITDDWGRPTPASEVVPLILEELHAAGAEDRNITFITASGMHTPMKKPDMERKLGKDIVAKYNCISHDAGDSGMLSYFGISDLGTPIWINRYVAEADYKVALGRIYLHSCHGFEGGYKMIVPGVSSFETIMRDHSMNFSETSVYGIHENPSRAETDAIGEQVGIDFLINVVVNQQSEPVKAFSGKVPLVHQTGISYGDKEVWGATTPWDSDITVVSEINKQLEPGINTEALRRATLLTKEGGIIIFESSSDGIYTSEPCNGSIDKNIANGGDVVAFNDMIRKISYSELLRLHEKRDWQLDERTIQVRVKAVRGEHYNRRGRIDAKGYQVLMTPDPASKLKQVLAEMDNKDVLVNMLLNPRLTMPGVVLS